jgi:chemotaxis signal transduction protein
MDINDRIVFARTSARKIAFIVDKLEGVVEFPPDRGDKAQQIIPEMAHCFEGVEGFNGTTVFIYNIDKLFSDQNMKGFDLNAEHGPTHGP